MHDYGSMTDDKNLALPKLKAFADDNFSMHQIVQFFEEDDDYQHVCEGFFFFFWGGGEGRCQGHKKSP